jgi:Carboxypeptidase regulatory-like domain
MKNSRARLLSVCFTAALSIAPVLAQVNYGTLTGTVEDQNGGAVPEAIVRVTNTATAQSRQAPTGSTGTYTLPDLPPGAYDVQVSAAGFRTFLRTGVAVNVNSVNRIDVQLAVGEVTEKVEVRAEVAALAADKPDVHVDLGSQEIVNLPLPNYRNFQSLLNLVPGASPGKFQNTIFGSPGRSLSTNINGTNRNNNNTRLDGVTDIRVGLPHQIRFVPPTETIQAVNVSTNNFDAEQGFAGGAAITIITKSGTNQFHGVMFENYTNDQFNAKDFFYQFANKPKSILNQFGGAGGGPIRKDKLFFYLSFEGMRERDNYSKFVTVSTPDQRAGNFSAYGVTLYDPQTGNPDGTGRTPFPNATIPLGRQSAIMLKLQSLIPAPNLPGTASNYFASAPVKLNRDNYDGKINWNPTNSTSMWAKYSAMPAQAVGKYSLGAAGGTGMTDGGGLGTSDFLAQFATVGVSHVITPTFIMDGVFGFGRDNYSNPLPDYGVYFGRDVLGIPGTNGPEIRYSGAPLFSISGYELLGGGANWMPQYELDSSLTYTTNFGWTKGKHDIRFGVDIARYWVSAWKPEQGNRGPRGQFVFTGGVTALNGGPSPNQFNGYADFLLGEPQNFGKSIQNYVPMAAHEWHQGYYFRDRWEAHRNLTVTLGLRWEYHPWFSRPNSGPERYDPATNQVYIGGLGGQPQNVGMTVSHKLFAPRVGLAYRLGQKTVIRTGFGISIDPMPLVRTARGDYPAVVNQDYFGLNSYQAAGPIANGIPTFTGPDTSKGVVPLPLSATTLTFNSGEFKRGYIESYNFLVERELPWQMVGSVAYVGTHTINQAIVLNVNAAPPGTGTAGRPYDILYGRAVDTSLYTNLGPAKYNSLQTQLDRHFAAGILVKASYTYGKAMNWTSDSGGSLAFNTPSMLWHNWAVADFDRTQTFRLAGVVEAPFGRGKRWFDHGAAATVLGGWQINSIFSKYSGLPFTVTASSASLNAPGNSQTADQVVPTVTKLGGIGVNVPYFDPLAFRPVTTARFGNTGLDILRGPGVTNLDTGLFRNFSLSERWKLQVRAESFNLTNTPHFANPSANVSNLSLNSNGTIRSLGNFMAVTSTATGSTNAEGAARNIRLAVRITF